MIDDRKLLCAFIFSAYESGYCGLKLDPETRQRHLELYRSFVRGETSFPEREIEETQKEMMDSVHVTGIRDYAYRGHLDIVKSRIEEEMEMDFQDAIRNTLSLFPALNCPVNFYRVIKIDGENLVGRNIFLPVEKKLFILEGLEQPKSGDVVSGHWDYFLERVDGWNDFEKYRKISEDYVNLVKRAIKNKK